MGVDAKGSEMVRAIVALALNLGMDVVAEGVENVQQMVALQTLGCAHAQGFYFSRPIPAKDLHTLLANAGRDALVTKQLQLEQLVS